VENSLNIFGFAAPGWFMKTEYRVAEYERVNLGETFVGGGLTTLGISVKPIVQTVSTSLVYRFNWGGPLVAKY
jgi:outer membrane immunogenic protein